MLEDILQEPKLLPLLPMIYVAWADGDLSDSEITTIRDRAQAQPMLDEQSRSLLAEWLNPHAPPTATALLRILRHIQEQSPTIPTSERQTLAGLGLTIAAADAAAKGDSAWTNRDAEQALIEIEGALGVVGADAARQLLSQGPSTPIARASQEPEPEFNVEAMKSLLDGRYAEEKQRVRQVLESSRFKYVYNVQKEEFRETIKDWLIALSKEGLGELAFPTAFDLDKDLGAFIAVFETLSFFDLSLVIKAGVQFGLFGGSIYHLGSRHHHQTYLPAVARGELLGCFALTELGHGSNARDIETTAHYDTTTHEFIIDTPSPSARKEWIGNAAAHGQMATVFARLILGEEDYGVHAFLVPLRSDDGKTLNGVRIEDCGEKMGLNGVDNGRIWFEQVRIPRMHMLDRYASVTEDGQYQSDIPSAGKRFFTMLSTLVAGRISIASSAVSVAKSALTIAIRYGALRRQFGPPGEPEIPILDYRTHQRRLMPLLAKTYALHFATEHLVQKFVTKDDKTAREVEALAAGLKAYSTGNTTRAVQVGRECCGGQGYLTVNRFPALKADSDIFTTFEGDNTVLMQLVAKSILGNYRQQFSDLNVISIFRLVADQAQSRISELDPITPRRTDPEHLQDSDFQIAALSYRERDLLQSAARRLKKRIDAGQSAFWAFNDIQNHVMALANAHIERVILEQFVAAVERCSKPQLQAQLKQLCDLFALSALYDDIGWFVEQGYVEGNKAKAIRRAVIDLCAQVRKQATHLVDAFDIPDNLLAAPIAFRDEAHAERI